MLKPNQFKQILDQIDSAYPSEQVDYKYIGTGNPDAKILIVGKETSIYADAHEQKEREIRNNLEDWKRIISNNKFQVEKWNGSNYSPLYPYKGQQFKIDNRKNGGTSRTWYNYQKLYNLIYGKVDNPNIDFHKVVFITEVNSNPSLKTKEADTSSIESRKKILLKSEFIKSFPVVIISGLGYFEISENKNEIEEIFGVRFTRKESALNRKSQSYWIHEGVNPPKLLINTRQLSIGVSDALLEAIAKEIRKSGLI